MYFKTIENEKLKQNNDHLTTNTGREIENLKERLTAMENHVRFQEDENSQLKQQLKKIQKEHKNLTENFTTKLEDLCREEVTLMEKAYEEEIERQIKKTREECEKLKNCNVKNGV